MELNNRRIAIIFPVKRLLAAQISQFCRLPNNSNKWRRKSAEYYCRCNLAGLFAAAAALISRSFSTPS